MHMNFAPLINSGLTQGEFAAWVGVSRPTVNIWVSRRAKPSHLVRDKVLQRLEALQWALDKNMLPPGIHLSDPERKTRVPEILATIQKSYEAAHPTQSE